MNILILSGSPRKDGNTELLAEAFAKGAAEHHHVEIVSVHDYKVNPCLGCNACFKTDGICAQKDDMALIYEKMSQTDMLVIASPVYFYSISAQLKAVIDRFHNPIRDSFHIKKMELSFDVPTFADVDKEYQNALNYGAKSVLPPTTEPWGQRTCYVADPDGNLIEIGSFVDNYNRKSE